MGGATYPAGATSLYGETLSLSATLASLGIPGFETKQAIVYNPNTDFRLHLNPAILSIWLYDNSQTGVAKWINWKTPGRDLTDRTTTGTGTTMDSFTESDRILICFADAVGGFYVDMNDASVNGTASRVMQCTYNVATTWTALTETDGTIVATAKTFGQDGAVTWTAPTDWGARRFGKMYGVDLAIDDVDTGVDTNEALDVTETGITMDGDPSSAILAGDYIIIESEVMYVHASSATGNLVTVDRGCLGSTAATHTTNQNVYIYRYDCPDATEGHWLKINVTGGALDADTEIQNLWSLNKNTNRGYFGAGIYHPVSFDRRAVGAIEAILAAGSDTMEINWIRTVI